MPHYKTLGLALMALIALASWSVSPVYAGDSAAELLERFSGSWQGNGKLRQKSDAKLEPIKCRFTGKHGGAAIDLKYVCIGVGLRFTSRGVIAGKADRYSGKLKTTGLGTAIVSGSRIGNAVALILKGKHPKTKAPTRDELILRIDNDHSFRMEIKAIDIDSGVKFTALQAVFKN